MLPETSRMHATWFIEKLVNQTLRLWLKASPRENGFFHPQFDRSWKPTDDDEGSLVSQTRLIYTMATGYKLTGDTRFRAAAEDGIEFLEEHFRDPDYGGYVNLCASDGTILSDAKDSYGHAFVILAYANAASIFGKPGLAKRAAKVWEEYKGGFADGKGGFCRSASRTFEAADTMRSQNPMMHLFEALVTLGSVPGFESMMDDAADVAGFVTGKLTDPETGLLSELFTMDWLPADESDGNRVDVGHAFEWAFLLSYAVQKGLPENYLSNAHRFLDNGLALGLRDNRGPVLSSASLNGTTIVETNHYWGQSEALRAMLHFLVFRDRPDLVAKFDLLAEYVRAHYIDDEYGGWYRSVSPDGSSENTEKGTIWKLDYHQTAMIVEFERIIRLT